MRLERKEAMAINWHMGGFDKRVVGGDFSLSKACGNGYVFLADVVKERGHIAAYVKLTLCDLLLNYLLDLGDV